jgi:hypothetical protein
LSASTAIAFVRTSAGMSPGFNAPSSEWTSTPSHTSTAILTRYSCERCIGLRVWKAAILDQPSASNRARVSAGVMNSAPYFSAKPPVDSTRTGPARFTSPCSITIFTPGCSASFVRNTVAHSCALSIVYFSTTVIVARHSPVSGSTSAMSCPGEIVAANCASADSVIGIGQKRPFAVRMPSQTLRQSACDMKPTSGVNPPMPSMITSPFSRELMRNFGRLAARSSSADRASPSSSRGRKLPPPWGGTSAMLVDLVSRCECRAAARTCTRGPYVRRR